MRADSASRQTFGKNSSHGFAGRMTLTERGLILGAGTLLAKLDDKALPIETEQERILTLLSVAYGEEISPAVFGSLRRVAKHWQGGDKCLAAIHLAQTGLPDIGEDAAYRLSLAAELIGAGVTPRELAQELGLRPLQFDVSKYDDNQPRVPAGSGRESGQWTSGDAAGSMLTEGRSEGADSGKVHKVPDLPKDAIVVKRPDGSTIYDPDSTTKRLMAPPRANFQEVYAAGERTANWPLAERLKAAETALQQFGTYDFQRDKVTNTYFDKYIAAANYAIGVYMAGAGFNLEQTYILAQGYALFNSSNWFKYWSKGRTWIKPGWDHAQRGDWKKK